MVDLVCISRDNRPLRRGLRVRLDERYNELKCRVGDRVGVVLHVGEMGTDWYGFSRVMFDGARDKAAWVPNSTLWTEAP